MLARLSRQPHLPKAAQLLLVLFMLLAAAFSHHRTTPSASAGTGMSDTAMQRQLAAWYSARPAHPRGGAATDAVVADSFRVENYNFDNNGDGGATQVDTAKISAGQAILWKWVVGTHTVTSGTGGADPNVGRLFDVGSTSSSPRFTFAFDSAGTYPFFCRLHESSNMRGVVVVSAPISVEPGPSPTSSIGFITAPFPNPTRTGAAFRFALRASGHARAEVYDLRGRAVAVLFDRQFTPGIYAGYWDTRTGEGSAAPAGTYWLRLSVLGGTATRRLVVVR